MRRNRPRSLLTAVAPLIVAGTSLIAATAAAGTEPAPPTPLPDSAFAPVTVPSAPSGAIAARGAAAAFAVRQVAPPVDARADVLANLASEAPRRARPRVREPERIVVELQPAPPRAPAVGNAAGTANLLRGAASWYCRAGVSPCTYTHPDGGGFDAYAAAGPKLRAAIGPGWRGTTVSVNGVAVKLIDWCQCYEGQRQEKLLDLYYDVYARTGGSVTIRW